MAPPTIKGEHAEPTAGNPVVLEVRIALVSVTFKHVSVSHLHRAFLAGGRRLLTQAYAHPRVILAPPRRPCV